MVFVVFFFFSTAGTLCGAHGEYVSVYWWTRTHTRRDVGVPHIHRGDVHQWCGWDVFSAPTDVCANAAQITSRPFLFCPQHRDGVFKKKHTHTQLQRTLIRLFPHVHVWVCVVREFTVIGRLLIIEHLSKLDFFFLYSSATFYYTTMYGALAHLPTYSLPHSRFLVRSVFSIEYYVLCAFRARKT